MANITLEVCCGAAGDVFEAKAAGAHRVELNSALFLGGLTPSMGTMRVAKDAGISVIAMVRPREGGFCYTQREFETMLADAEALLKAGADGIAFGILTEDGQVDMPRCQKMMDVAGPAQTVFHRAFDVTPDWRRALDDLMALGVTRLLTSGQEPSAHYGAETIRQMMEHAAGRIEILPGGGVRPNNVHDILQKTGCTQVHVSLRKSCPDPTGALRGDIHFGGALYPPEDSYGMTDRAKVSAFLQSLG